VTGPRDATDVKIDDGFFPFSAVRHGTLAGYDVHRTRGQVVCPDCRAYRARYDVAYRERRRRWELVRRRAVAALVSRHAAEFERLLRDERERLARETETRDVDRT